MKVEPQVYLNAFLNFASSLISVKYYELDIQTLKELC